MADEVTIVVVDDKGESEEYLFPDTVTINVEESGLVIVNSNSDASPGDLAVMVLNPDFYPMITLVPNEDEEP